MRRNREVTRPLGGFEVGFFTKMLNRLLVGYTIREAAADLAYQANMYSRAAAGAFLDLVLKYDEGPNHEANKGLEQRLVWEFLLLYSHLVDRHAFAILGPERRSTLMELMFPAATGVMALTLSRVSPAQATQEVTDMMAQVTQGVTDRMKARMDTFNLEFTQYTWDQQEGQGLKGTIFWEFTKHISAWVGREDDGVFLMAATIIAMKGTIELPIAELLEKIR